MPDILHYITIKSPPEKAYAALIEETGLSGWWTRDVKAEPKVRTVNKFRFGSKGFSDMKVAELVPRQPVKCQCVDASREWIGTEVTVDLKSENGVNDPSLGSTGLAGAG